MKATAFQAQQRTDELVRILLAGAKPLDIREYVSEKAPDPASCWHVPEGGKPLSDKQLFNYARKASAALAASSKETRRGRLRRHLAQRQYLYAQAVAAADWRTALAVLDSEGKLLSLFDADLVQQVDALRKQLADLKGQQQHGHGTPQAAAEGTPDGTGGAGRAHAAGAG